MTYHVLELVYYDYHKFNRVIKVSANLDQLQRFARDYRFFDRTMPIYVSTDPTYDPVTCQESETVHMLITPFEEEF